MAEATSTKKAAAPAAAKKAPAKTRTVLTDAQRIEKLEADLAAVKAKAAAKASKASDELKAKRDKLTTKITSLQAQVREIDEELERLGDGSVPDPDPIVEASA